VSPWILAYINIHIILDAHCLAVRLQKLPVYSRQMSARELIEFSGWWLPVIVVSC